MRGYMYILECADKTYYTGSTKDLAKRIDEHNNSMGANYTKKRLPVTLVYYEEYTRIDEAFYREKQVQNWSHEKKQALIESDSNMLRKLAECRNETHSKNHRSSSGVETIGLLDLNRPLGSARGPAEC